MFSKELLYKTEGLVLKKQEANDVDALLTLYTKKRGKILVKAKGVRKRESKLKGFLEPFSFNSFLLARGKGLTDALAGAESLDGFWEIRKDLQRMAVAFYAIEVLDKTIPVPEADEQIWNLVIRFFETLNNRKYEPRKIKIAFERKLLEILGYGLNYKNVPAKICQLADEPLKSYKFLNQCWRCV